MNLSRLTGRVRSGGPFLESVREMAAPERAFVKLILINSVAISFLSLVIPVSVQSIITNLGILNQRQPVIVMTVVLFIILVFSGGIQVVQFHAIEILRRRLFLRFGAAILDRVTRYREDAYKHLDPMQLAKRHQDVVLAQASMVTFFVDGIGFTVQYVISMSLLCLYHPYFLFMGVVISVMLYFSWMLFGPVGITAGVPEADWRYKCMGWIDEVLRARPLFMSQRGREFAERKFVGQLAEWSGYRVDLFNQQFVQTVVLQLINAVVYTMLLGIGYLLVNKGQLSVGQLVAAFIVVAMLLATLPRLQNFYISIYDYSTSLDMLAEFYAHPLEEDSEGVASEFPGALDFHFQEALLEENVRLDFKVEPGDRVYAYVRSFAVSRMVIQALQGFLPPKGGELLVAGRRFDGIRFSSLRNHVAVVGDKLHFGGTVRENLIAVCGRQPDTTELENALQAMHLLETVKALPKGIDSELLPNGFPLSASEATALQMARVLITRPGLVLVTPDFDKMSLDKRKAAKNLLLDRTNDWTVVFFSQRVLKGAFSHYVVAQRDGVHAISGAESVLQEIEKYE